MSDRIDPSWKVLSSIESEEGNQCVDIFVRPDGSFGFEEFRLDSEDMGKWTGVSYYSVLSFETQADALQNATLTIPWLS